ncbi:hypothetical protein [Methylosinus sp. Sm6]|nr:hypothetical protein [Methylosinus sp. Sm6]MBY6240302.1 hypothetical protein [Methylosinus sp. Sm6]
MQRKQLEQIVENCTFGFDYEDWESTLPEPSALLPPWDKRNASSSADSR